MFLVSVAVNLVYYDRQEIYDVKHPNGGKKWYILRNQFFDAETAMYVCSFVSQCLLCLIFWQLTKQDFPEDSQEHDEAADTFSNTSTHRRDSAETVIAEVRVADFDDDAQLQLRIWNTFRRLEKNVTSTLASS